MNYTQHNQSIFEYINSQLESNPDDVTLQTHYAKEKESIKQLFHRVINPNAECDDEDGDRMVWEYNRIDTVGVVCFEWDANNQTIIQAMFDADLISEEGLGALRVETIGDSSLGLYHHDDPARRPILVIDTDNIWGDLEDSDIID